jgi:RNA polymerase sigma-70 factor (ECF subfamily)
VFSIAHNRAMDAHRRRARDKSAPTAEPELLDEGAMDDRLWSADPQLVAALATLSDDQREVVVLRFVGDLSLESVAKITGRRVGAVKALQHRGLENLRKAVSRDE